MVLVALAMCVLVAVFGAVGVVYPEVLVGVIRAVFETPTRLYVAAGIRVVFGVALFFAAPTSRAPRTPRALGVVIFVAGLTMPVFGVEFFRSLVDEWLALGPGFHRAWGISALVFGALLAYALVPRSRAA